MAVWVQSRILQLVHAARVARLRVWRCCVVVGRELVEAVGLLTHTVRVPGRSGAVPCMLIRDCVQCGPVRLWHHVEAVGRGRHCAMLHPESVGAQPPAFRQGCPQATPAAYRSRQHCVGCSGVAGSSGRVLRLCVLGMAGGGASGTLSHQPSYTVSLSVPSASPPPCAPHVLCIRSV